MGTSGKQEKRIRERRDDLNSKTRLPFFDRADRIIIHERRGMPDRRLNNIELKIISD